MKNLYILKIFVVAFFIFSASCSKDDDGGNEGDTLGDSDYFPLITGSIYDFTYDHIEDDEFINSGMFDMSVGASSTKSDALEYYPLDFSYGGSTFLGGIKDIEIARSGRSVYATGILGSEYLDLGLGLSFPIGVENKLRILRETAKPNGIIEKRLISINLDEQEGNEDLPRMKVNSTLEIVMQEPESSVTLKNGKTYNDILNTRSSLVLDIVFPFPESTYEDVETPLGNISVIVPQQDLIVLEPVEIQYSKISYANYIGMVRDETRVTPSNIQLIKKYSLSANVSGISTTIDLDFSTRKISTPLFSTLEIDFSDVDDSLNDIADFFDQIQERVDDDKEYHETINELNVYTPPIVEL